MSIFATLAGLARRRSPAASSAAGKRARDTGVQKLPGFSPRDKKRGAGTKAGFGRKGRSLNPTPPSARPGRAARTSRPAPSASGGGGGIRGFVSSILGRLRRA